MMKILTPATLDPNIWISSLSASTNQTTIPLSSEPCSLISGVTFPVVIIARISRSVSSSLSRLLGYTITVSIAFTETVVFEGIESVEVGERLAGKAVHEMI